MACVLLILQTDNIALQTLFFFISYIIAEWLTNNQLTVVNVNSLVFLTLILIRIGSKILESTK